MPAPATPFDISPTVASNGPDGAVEQVSVLDDYLRGTQACIRQLVNKGADIASAATITPAATASYFDVTGTTGITGIASTNSWDGRVIKLQFDNSLTLTHSATLALPGSVNYTTQTGDVLEFVQEASGTWRCTNQSRSNTGSFGAGSAAAPSVRFLGAVTSGLYSPGTDQVGISTAGEARMTFAAAGNVAVNAPSSGEHTINGNVNLGNSGAEPTVLVQNPLANSGQNVKFALQTGGVDNILLRYTNGSAGAFTMTVGDTSTAALVASNFLNDNGVNVNGVNVVRARATGWGAPTGTATRTTFATGSVTLPQLAERLKALIDDLTTHGLIGP